jgi:hypothetical protein
VWWYKTLYQVESVVWTSITTSHDSDELWTLPTIWGTNMKLVTIYQISAINSCWEKCDEKCAYMFNVHKNQLSRQTGSRNLTDPTLLIFIHIEHISSFFVTFFSATVDGRNLRYGHKLHSKQEVRIWWVHKRFPRYGVPIWSLWPNIRFLPSIVAEKNVTKNVHICSMCIKNN